MKKCIGYFFVCLLLVSSTPLFVFAQAPQFPTPATRTIIADVLAVEGEYIIVRGELGEIRIVVKPDTKISEKFQFGDRIKAVIRPNDSAISVERAGTGEPTGIKADAPATPPSSMDPEPPSPTPVPSDQPSSAQANTLPIAPSTGPTTRIIVADLLMVDGAFYVVRGERGEIRIEATSDTKVTEAFKFGDRIKAKVLPDDKAMYIKRAKPEDAIGIQTIKPRAQPQSPQKKHVPEVKAQPIAPVPETGSPKPPKNTRTIVAEVLMKDRDFLVVRGERGEIRIEVTADTKISEKFDFGDKIKATVLPNDRALSVQRAKPEDPIGITKN